VSRSLSTAILHLCAVEITATTLLRPQLVALQQRGFDIRLACEPGQTGFDPSLAPFDPVEIRYPRKVDLIGVAKASERVLSILHEMRPAAVHLHTPAAALQFRFIPRSLFPKGTKILYTVHGFAHLWGTGKPRDFILERTERLLAHRTDVMYFQSIEDFENAERRRYSSNLVYLGNGVGDEWFEVPPPPVRRGALKAIFIGRLVREKGILDLLEALAHAQDVELCVVGAQAPSDRDGVASEVARLAGSDSLKGRVRCVGLLSQSELREEMSAVDLVILPSYREGVPRSLIEGLAAGRPILTTDTRGCRELVAEGTNGMLVPVGRPDQLARALRKMAELGTDDLIAMGKASKSRASSFHREQLIFNRLISSYEAEGLGPAST
jgi:glycosyltransferase involved in cell wall biosynthesis